MGISKLPRDTKELLQHHSALFRELRQIPAEFAELPREIRDAADALVERQVRSRLKEIPVEEVNRNKRGIRVKTLRDQGYETAADLYNASPASLAAINGISDAGAAELGVFTRNLADQLRTGCKIRLSSDDRSPEASRLIHGLSRYTRSRMPLKECTQLCQLHDARLLGAEQRLEQICKPLRWLFASRDAKQQAIWDYDLLQAHLTGFYGNRTGELIRELSDIQACGESEAWEDFSRNSIRFFGAMEEICPGVLGTGDAVCGLPEDLAKAVQQEPIHSEGLRCTLRHYQEWGVRYILHQKKVLLGDEMGLGKTVQAIAVMVSLRNTGSTRFLVVCPASVLENWCREIRKHSNLTVIRIHGSDREQARDEWLRTGGVGVTTYETTGFFHLAPESTLDLVVVDEAHYIKNPQAQRTEHVTEICSHAGRILFMTGTALENRVDEMLTLMAMLQPKVAEAAGEMASLASAPQFRDRIAPVYYRRKREDVLTELPDLIEKEEWCTLGPEEEQIYETSVLSDRFTECRRVSWNADIPEHSCKARRMMELIEDAREDGRKVIVFSFFLDTIETVRSLLGDQALEPINGSVPPQRRQEIVDAFTKAPAGTVLTAQIQAGGTGLNIQAASVVILCEPQFKPSMENQAISRAYRMGQTRNVLVYRLLCENTVDERITDLLEQKQAQFDAFADESSAADESFELDQAGLHTILEEEKQRIADKYPDHRLPFSVTESISETPV